MDTFNGASIKETTFGPKKYLALKKSISTEQITDKEMYDQAGKKLGAYMEQKGITPAGSWSVIYFTWDEPNKKTDIGIAFPVANLSYVEDPELSIVDVAESKAVMAVMNGSYSALGQTHQALMQYVEEHSLATKDVPVMAVEEYVISPNQEADPDKLITNIYYLHN